VILGDEPGEDSQEDQKEDGPNEDGTALKELDILVIFPRCTASRVDEPVVN
jgi:hypothetical protein